MNISIMGYLYDSSRRRPACRDNPGKDALWPWFIILVPSLHICIVLAEFGSRRLVMLQNIRRQIEPPNKTTRNKEKQGRSSSIGAKM